MGSKVYVKPLGQSLGKPKDGKDFRAQNPFLMKDYRLYLFRFGLPNKVYCKGTVSVFLLLPFQSSHKDVRSPCDCLFKAKQN